MIKVDITKENEHKREEALTRQADVTAREMQKKHPNMSVVRTKLASGFKNKSALTALCAVLALASVGGAVKLGDTMYNMDTQTVANVRQDAPVDDFSCKIRINDSERAVIDAENNVKIDGLKCGSLSDFNNIRSFELIGNSGDVLTAYEHSKFLQNRMNGTLRDKYLNSEDTSLIDVKTAAFGSSMLTVKINESEYKVKKNKITKDDRVIYRVDSRNNERIIEKVDDDKEMTMSRAILLLEYLNGYNEYVREMDIRAE